MLTVSAMLLITCVNIAGLLLAKGSSRRKEIATRVALGAPRSRLIRQLLTECLVLAMIGGSLGIALTYGFSPFLTWLLRQFAIGPFGTLKQLAVDVVPDLRVLIFSIAVLVLSAIIFGLVPSMAAVHVDLVSMLNHASSRSDGRSRSKTYLASRQPQDPAFPRWEYSQTHRSAYPVEREPARIASCRSIRSGPNCSRPGVCVSSKDETCVGTTMAKANEY